MSVPKVSVIVPVYNTSEFLPKCLESLINQTLKDIEIICVNDSSTDNSLEILNEYAGKDKRIVIINLPENRRQGGARNAGIKIATGEYLGFVDSDDWIDERMYESLYSKATSGDYDIVTSDYWIEKANKREYIKNSSSEILSFSNNERNKYLLTEGFRSVTNIYLRHFWKNMDLYYPEHVAYEDNAIEPIISIMAKSIGKVDEAFYHYRFTNVSTTRSSNNPHFWDRLQTSDILLDNLTRFGCVQSYPKECEFIFTKLYLVNTLIGSLSKCYPPPKQSEIFQMYKHVRVKYPHFEKNKYYRKLSKGKKTLIFISEKSYKLAYILVRNILKPLKKLLHKI